jgi:hypothetical protein
MMEQETVTNPEAVTEEAPETEVTEAEALETEEQEQPETPAPEDDFEDTEWEGKTFRAPKGAKSAMMMHADYTQKTQSLAAEKKAWAESVEADRTFTHDVGRLMTIDERLEQYSKVDWQAFNANNPQGAQAAYFEYQQLRDQRSSLANDLNHRSQQKAAQAEQEIAAQMSQEHAALTKPDPAYGWDGKFTPERQTALSTFAKSQGYTDEQLARVTARDVKTLNAAMNWANHLKQQRAAAKPPATEAKPVPKVEKGRGNVKTGLHDDLSPEEWVRRRNAQIEARG